jgi:sulfate transport system ATP-binding protein
MSIEVQGIEKSFGRFRALDGVSLTVNSGELLALLGPSGSGKTTLLRIIAGLETPDRGTVHLGGEEATSMAARDRGVGFVFQHYALFRHMDVTENVAFGLRVRPSERRPSPAEISRRVGELLHLVGLDAFASHRPWQLSGGQRQRVALARALAVEPGVLLLDEPFGALDANVRRELRYWLRGLHEKIGVTTAFVTHDQEEALELADRIAIFNEGRIEQIGSPDEVYDRPRTAFVCRFLGEANLFAGDVEGGRLTIGRGAFAIGDAPVGAPPRPLVCVRTHEFDLVSDDSSGFRAVVTSSRRIGATQRIDLQAAWGEPVQITLPAGYARSPVAGAALFLRPRTIHLVPDGAPGGPGSS